MPAKKELSDKEREHLNALARGDTCCQRPEVSPAYSGNLFNQYRVGWFYRLNPDGYWTIVGNNGSQLNPEDI